MPRDVASAFKMLFQIRHQHKLDVLKVGMVLEDLVRGLKSALHR